MPSEANSMSTGFPVFSLRRRSSARIWAMKGVEAVSPSKVATSRPVSDPQSIRTGRWIPPSSASERRCWTPGISAPHSARMSLRSTVSKRPDSRLMTSIFVGE